MRGLLCVLLALTAIALASRPRGVAPADKALYQGNQFKCRDGSFVISISQVNDDYCDCPDGSDEPGTSACSNGAFWCKNKGFRSFTIPSWKVNDHICDCCDGSDEFDGHTRCTNNCAELDRESKQSVVAELERLKSGLEKKRGYIAAGEEALKKAAASIADLKAEIEHKREELKVKEERKRKAEESERDASEARRLKEAEEKAVHEAAHPSPPAPPAEDAPQIVDAELHHDHHHHGGDHADFDTVHDDEAKGDVPEDLHQPVVEEPTPPPPTEAAPSEQPPFEASDELRDLQVEEQKHADGPLPPPHIREELERGYLAARKAKQSLWQTAKSAVADLFHSLLSALSFFGDSDDEGEDGDAKRARDTFNDASGKLRELETKLEKAEKLLQLDLGPQKEFFPLYDRTFTTQIEHYQYHLKPFDEVNQGHTNMGKWGSWSVPHTKMSYSNGQSCWQGPARSCEVTLVCGEKEEILEVKEPNKCEYSMKFTTPAACREADVERLERQLKASESDDE